MKIKVVHIESTNLCNFKCSFCPHTKMKRKKGIMDFELYKKIIDEIKDWGIEELNLTGFGEPLLDPLLTEKIKYARKKMPNVLICLLYTSPSPRD